MRPRLLSLALLLTTALGGLLVPVAHAEDSAVSLLKQMIAIAAEDGGVGRTAELNALKEQIEALPKPARGDRKTARAANDAGLAALKAMQFEQAKKYFLSATQADPADIEIAGNLGFAALNARDFKQAMKGLSAALALAPGRSSAWVTLAEYFAVQGQQQQAVACYALIYHFSKDQDKTRSFLQKWATESEEPKVRQAMSQALQLSLISGNVEEEETVADAPAEDLLDAPSIAAKTPQVAAPAGPVVDSVPVVPTTSTPPVSPVLSPLSAETQPQSQQERSQLAQNLVNTPSSTTNGVQTVVSDGLGTDIPSAAQNAAQNALTNVVGSFIDSTKLLEKRVEIQEGIRSQTSRIDTNIKEYSQGTIQHFEVLETTQQGGLTKVTAKVTVRIEDFKAYIKKLAEGKAAVDVGLFSSLSLGAKQKENLEEIVVDLITPIAKGEVSRFEVGKPVSLDEGKKAIDGLYLKAMNKFSDTGSYNSFYDSINSNRQRIPEYIDEFSKRYNQSFIIYIPVTVTIDPGFYDNARKKLENIAHVKKKFKISHQSNREFDSYYEYKDDIDLLLGVLGIQGSLIIGDVYTIKGISIRLKNKFPWLAVGTKFYDAIKRGDNSFKDIAPHLEIDFIDVNGQRIKSFDVSFSNISGFKDGSGKMLFSEQFIRRDYIGYPDDLPWSLLISFTDGYSAFPFIIPKREFGILLALDESTLKNAKDIKLSLVPPSSSPK